MSRKTICILAGAALAALISGTALSQERVGKDTLLGGPVTAGDQVDRVVNIGANTRWANAVQGETVKFVVGGRDFSWNFLSSKSAVNLKDIAPSGTVDRDLYVYLTPNSLYQSDE